MGKAPELGTTYLCRSHGRRSAPAWYKGEKRMRHAGPGDYDWCFSQRFTERVVREVDRADVLAQLAGEGPENESAQPAAIGEDGGP